MQVTLTISDELAAQANARGVPLEVYVQNLIVQAAPKALDSSTRRRTFGEFHAWLEEFTQYSSKMPILSDQAISRETIYQDRD
jgi:hypothetical protein